MAPKQAEFVDYRFVKQNVPLYQQALRWLGQLTDVRRPHGLHRDAQQFYRGLGDLRSIGVDISYCFENRYWRPMELNGTEAKAPHPFIMEYLIETALCSKLVGFLDDKVDMRFRMPDYHNKILELTSAWRNLRTPD